MADKADEYLRFDCAECEKRLKVRKEKNPSGAKIKCPRCGHEMRVPEREEFDVDRWARKLRKGGGGFK